MNAWTLADVLAVDAAGWPGRHHLEADLAAWLAAETRAAADRNWRIHHAREAGLPGRVRSLAARELARTVPATPGDVARRRAVLAGFEPDGVPHLVAGVWHWSAA